MGGSPGVFDDGPDGDLFTEVWEKESETWSATDNMMTTPRAGYGHATVPLATVCP